MPLIPDPKAREAILKSRPWLIAGGILSLIAGFLAMSFPLMFSFVIAQVLGAFAFFTGIVSLFMAIAGKHVGHRVLTAVSGIIRIVAGVFLLMYVHAGVNAITLILGVFLIIEGIVVIASAVKMRSHDGWAWMLLNGIAALILGLLVYIHWPNDSNWILGLFFGINSIFSGVSLLALALAAKSEP